MQPLIPAANKKQEPGTPITIVSCGTSQPRAMYYTAENMKAAARMLEEMSPGACARVPLRLAMAMLHHISVPIKDIAPAAANGEEPRVDIRA